MTQPTSSWLADLLAGYKTILVNGIALIQRNTLNFGSGFTVVDDPTNKQTTINATGGGSSGGQNPVTLSNGLNSDIPTNGLPSIHITGPTSAFSIGGFSPPSGPPTVGTLLTVINTTTQLVTIVPNDGGSTYPSATQSGAPVLLPPGRKGRALFIFDASNTWILIFERNSIWIHT